MAMEFITFRPYYKEGSIIIERCFKVGSEARQMAFL